VVLEIANENHHGGFSNWQDGDWLRSVEGQIALIRLARASHPELLVSTSYGGHGRFPEALARVADFALIHLNLTDLEDYQVRIEAARAYGKPVVCNEDHKEGAEGARAAELAIRHGAGWGLMLMEKNQMAPFEFKGVADDPEIYQRLASLTARAASK